MRDIAASLGITERSAYGIVAGLAEAGYIVKQKDGRRNAATAARTRPAGHHRRRNPGPPGRNRRRAVADAGRTHLEPPPPATMPPQACRLGRAPAGSAGTLKWMPATWFSRTWATATARLTAGPARASGAMAAIMKTSPADRCSARHGCGRWAAAPELSAPRTSHARIRCASQ